MNCIVSETPLVLLYSSVYHNSIHYTTYMYSVVKLIFTKFFSTKYIVFADVSWLFFFVLQDT